jgi:hypothetical protein
MKPLKMPTALFKIKMQIEWSNTSDFFYLIFAQLRKRTLKV